MYRKRQLKTESRNSFNLFIFIYLCSFYLFIYLSIYLFYIKHKSNKVKCHTIFKYSA